jgi:hypothetical protein
LVETTYPTRLPSFRTQALRSSRCVYFAGCPTPIDPAWTDAPALRREQWLRHFSRSAGPVSVWPLYRAPAQDGRTLFFRRPSPSCATRPFSTTHCWADYSRSSRFGYRSRRGDFHPYATPTLGLGWSTCSTAAFRATAECSRPTVFTGPPLLTGTPNPLRSLPAFTGKRSLALGCVSDRLVITTLLARP